jgi:hypothetical protein
MRIESQIESLPVFVQALADGPSIGQQVKAVDLLTVLDDISLPADQD